MNMWRREACDARGCTKGSVPGKWWTGGTGGGTRASVAATGSAVVALAHLNTNATRRPFRSFSFNTRRLDDDASPPSPKPRRRLALETGTEDARGGVLVPLLARAPPRTRARATCAGTRLCAKAGSARAAACLTLYASITSCSARPSRCSLHERAVSSIAASVARSNPRCAGKQNTSFPRSSE